MSGEGTPDAVALAGGGLSVAIVAGRWHPVIAGGLVDAAVATIEAAGAMATVYRVPGAFELPLAARAASAAGFDAIVALGVVVQGETPHFDYVCRAATDGLVRAMLDSGVPIGFGLLTCDDEEQAFERSGLEGATHDKGREAAEAALAMVGILRSIKSPASVRPTGF